MNGLFDQQSADRIAAAVLKSERPDPLDAPAPRVFRPLPAPLRCVLLEPMYGHGQALAMRTRRVEDYSVQEIQVVGTPPTNGRFKLSIEWDRETFVSDWILWTASASELWSALQTWTFASGGSLYTGLGTVTPEEVPDTLQAPTDTLKIGRWSISFVGPQFEGRDIPQIQIADHNLGAMSLVISHPSKWVTTGEVILVREGGFLIDNPQSYSYSTRRTPLAAGAAVGCIWMPDAGGYVVWPAEPRKFS